MTNGTRVPVLPYPLEQFRRAHSWPTYNLFGFGSILSGNPTDELGGRPAYKTKRDVTTGNSVRLPDAGAYYFYEIAHVKGKIYAVVKRAGNGKQYYVSLREVPENVNLYRWLCAVRRDGRWTFGKDYISPKDVWDGKEVGITWGYKPEMSDWHGAVDIQYYPKAAPYQPVLAIWDGKVVRSRGYSDGGSSVWIMHDIPEFGRALTVYQHLKMGERPPEDTTVSVGDKIGEIGNLRYGGAKAPHLHLEMIADFDWNRCPLEMKVPCNEENGLMSQFGDIPEHYGIRRPYYMYNGLYVIKKARNLLGAGNPF
jgi:murein DD-endopeptidase MepM/ murein hydrolase activator NlpD